MDLLRLLPSQWKIYCDTVDKYENTFDAVRILRMAPSLIKLFVLSKLTSDQ